MRKTACLLIASVICLSGAYGQSINLLRPSQGAGTLGFREESAGEHLAIPAGVNANLSTNDAIQAGGDALLGFQYWKENEYFISAYFSFSDPTEVSGSQAEYGAFLLNPNTNGYSGIIEGNYLFHALGAILVGPSLKVGVVGTTWSQTVGATTNTVKGFVGFGTLSLQIDSIPFSFNTPNSYQLGGEVGYSLRFLGGGFTKPSIFISDATVLGTDEVFFGGPEVTVFLRLNSIAPYARINFFKTGAYIDNFSNSQLTIGVKVLSSMFNLGE